MTELRSWPASPLLLFFVLLAACTGPRHKPSTITPGRGETVVLIHGLGGSARGLSKLAEGLSDAGYDTHTFGYSARKHSLDEISQLFQEFIDEHVETEDYHLVGFSMGNVVIRKGFQRPYRKGLRRLVMIAPPNNPVYLARKLNDCKFYQWIAGEPGQSLASQDFYKTLPKPTVPFGIISGNPDKDSASRGPHDGVVSVEETRLEGYQDWAFIDAYHPFLRGHRETLAYTRSFLAAGRFSQS